MIRLYAQDAKDVKSLVRKLCCNYYEGNCLLLDDGEQHECPQCSAGAVVCKWFRDAVLPQNTDLSIRLTRPDKSKLCSVCGKLFTYRSDNKKYCDTCKRTILRKQKADYQRKYRQKQKN